MLYKLILHRIRIFLLLILFIVAGCGSEEGSNDNDIGMILLRLVEIIGEDQIEDIGTEALYFITTILNEIDLDYIRNSILLKTLPKIVVKHSFILKNGIPVKKQIV